MDPNSLAGNKGGGEKGCCTIFWKQTIVLRNYIYYLNIFIFGARFKYDTTTIYIFLLYLFFIF